ncbi:NAD(P)/FAD-dependent oxidoreductase [Ferrimonas balearica]|uniref:NAD(P)/FAD-dependent oxidoreductase n=1 Tax=Ferrimonas balearica TaxID=44012 RepID=UPI001C99B0E7|nr:FAD-dependent oxidoreductase [Ferrimonas balearica]MBY5993966.1 FAD-binding oxidoreductase [Ferrimonas balearica]
MNNEDVVIVGAGVVGLTTAAALSRAGRRVLLLDPLGPGEGTSYGNAGHFATEQVFPLADPALLPRLPGMLLDPLGPFRIRLGYLLRALPWFGRFLLNMRAGARARNTEALRRLNEAALAQWGALLGEWGLESHLVREGSLLVFERTDEAKVQRILAQYLSQGVAARYLDRAALRALEPALSEAVQRGIWFTDTGHTPDPYALSLGIWQRLREQGARHRAVSVAAIEPGGTVVLEGGERLVAREVILCAGAHSKVLAAGVGHRLPLDTERGYHLMLPGHSGLTRPVSSYERSFIITPMAGGTRLAGTVEFAGLAAPMDPRRADILLTHGQALLPGLEGKGAERWMGYRPSLPDSLPVMGAAAPGVWFNFGHQHLGLTQAAVSGAWLADAVLQGQSAPLAPFSPRRFTGP